METKRIIEELEEINDINTLSLNELIDKYFENEDKYKKFIKNYGDIFVNKLLYQLRVFSYHKKIMDLIENGNSMYKDEECEKIGKDIVASIDKIYNKFKIGSLQQDEIQARSLFTDLVGVNKTKSIKGYESIVSGIYDVAKKYENRDGNSLEEYLDFAMFMRASVDTIENSRYINAIEKYKKSHNLAYLCNDVNYLYFVNYILKLKTSYVDDEFINDSIEVIKTSLELNDFKFVTSKSDINEKDYNKVAKYTLKNILKYKKRKDKEEIKKLKK